MNLANRPICGLDADVNSGGFSGWPLPFAWKAFSFTSEIPVDLASASLKKALRTRERSPMD
jgi:hypothetical protein